MHQWADLYQFIKLPHIAAANAKDKLLRKIDHRRQFLTQENSWDENCKADVGWQQPAHLTAELSIKQKEEFRLVKESNEMKNI